MGVKISNSTPTNFFNPLYFEIQIFNLTVISKSLHRILKLKLENKRSMDLFTPFDDSGMYGN